MCVLLHQTGILFLEPVLMVSPKWLQYYSEYSRPTKLSSFDFRKKKKRLTNQTPWSSASLGLCNVTEQAKKSDGHRGCSVPIWPSPVWQQLSVQLGRPHAWCPSEPKKVNNSCATNFLNFEISAVLTCLLPLVQTRKISELLVRLRPNTGMTQHRTPAVVFGQHPTWSFDLQSLEMLRKHYLDPLCICYFLRCF